MNYIVNTNYQTPGVEGQLSIFVNNVSVVEHDEQMFYFKNEDGLMVGCFEKSDVRNFVAIENNCEVFEPSLLGYGTLSIK